MADTVQNRPTPKGIVDLLDKRLSGTGFQRAHIIGDAFANRPALAWFRDLLGPAGANERFNSVLLPEAERGGAILGAAVHYQEHVEEFNQLFYDSDPTTGPTSNKYMNKLQRARNA